MKREVVQDFLNLPGIAGVALMDGHSRPYFCGIDQTLNFQQKEALAQGILQVVETIPNGFESFEFQFTGHQVHIYKLERGIILLVLTRSDIVYSDYLETIKNLKAVLQEDISNAIATFRLLAGNPTLTGSTYHKRPSAPTTRSDVGTVASNNSSKTSAASSQEISSVSETSEAKIKAVSFTEAQSASRITGETVAHNSYPATVTLQDLVAALNFLSDFTSHYLGTQVITNYWKTTRPHYDWLKDFEIDRTARFSFQGADAQIIHKPVGEQEHQWIREWVDAFIKRCSRIIRDFPTIVRQKALNDELKALLLG